MSTSTTSSPLSLSESLALPVDGSSVAWVRLVFAVRLLWDTTWIFLSGDIEGRYRNPYVFFKYPFFPAIPEMSGYAPYGLFVLIALLGLGVLLGWRTTWTTRLLALAWTYIFLVDATSYSDHAYLMVLLALLMAWLPVNRWMSADRSLGREVSTVVPQWGVMLLRLQFAIIIIFNGVSRIQGDWLSGTPLTEWALVFGPHSAISEALRKSPGWFVVFGWLLAIGPIVVGLLLLWRRAVWLALPLWWIYSLVDGLWFHIGSSPLMMALLSVVFLPPDIPRRIGDGLSPWVKRIPLVSLVWRLLSRVGTGVDRIVGWFDDGPKGARVASPSTANETGRHGVSEWIRYALAAWLVIQIVVPFRWIAYSRSKDWAEYTSRFSWWGEQRNKQTRVTLTFVLEEAQLRWNIDPAGEFPIPLACVFSQQELQGAGLNEGILRDLVRASEQSRTSLISGANFGTEKLDRLFRAHDRFQQLQLSPGHLEIVIECPEFIRQYAHAVAEGLQEFTKDRVRVHALVEVSLNSRPFQVGLKSDVDLAELRSASELWPSVQPIKDPLPALDTRIAAAEAVRKQREMDLELELRTMGLRRPPEPQKAPSLSAADEAWLQANFPD